MKDYLLQTKVDQTLYEDWKRFLKSEGYRAYSHKGVIMKVNRFAAELGMMQIMNNPKLLEEINDLKE